MILNQNNLEEVNKYNEFVRKNEHAQFTQDTAWAHVKNNWQGEYVYLTDSEGEIRAALSIIMIEAVPGSMFMYAPRGPVCDFYDIETVRELIEAAKPLAEKYNAFLLRMDPEIFEDDELVEKYRDLGFTFRSKETDLHALVQPRWNVMMDLDKYDFEGDKDDPEYGLNIFKSKTRNSIRKGLKMDSEVIYYEGKNVTDQEVDIFYELIEIMAERQGINHRPKDYYKRLLEAYPDARLYFIKHGEDYLAGSISIPYGKKVAYLYAATSNIKRNYNAGDLLIFELIKWTHSIGKKYFDFGGVFSDDSSDGLYKFKKGFAGEEGLFKFIGELDVVFNEEKYQEYLKK